MFFFAICVLNAQKVDSLFNTRSFLKKNILLANDANNQPVIICKNKYIELLKPNFHQQIRNTFTPKNYKLDLSSCYSVNVGSNLYVISRDGSTVYNYDKESGLKKLNNPTTTKSYYKCSIFSHGGSIYRLGGYGYFQHKSQLFKFDFVNRKWKYIREVLKNNFGFIDAKTLVVDNKVHVISPKIRNNFNNKEFFSNYIYTIDLDNYYIEKYKFDFDKFSPYFNQSFYSNNYFKFKNTLGLINRYDFTKAIIIDFKKKTSSLVKLNSSTNSSGKIIYSDNKLFYLIDDSNSSRQDFTDFIKVRVSVSKIVEIFKEKSFDQTNPNTKVGFLSLAFLIFFIIYIKRKRSPFLVVDKSIKKGNNSMKLDIDEKFFVERLIRDAKVENHTLISYFDKDGKSYDLNVKRKNSMVSKLSTKFYSQFQKDLFEKVPSFIDKRQSVYVLKQKLILASKKS